MLDELFPQEPYHFHDIPAPMAESVFQVRRHFGRGLGLPVWNKNRVITKPFYPAFLLQNNTIDAAFEEVFISSKDQAYHTTEAGVSILLFSALQHPKNIC